ncbi:zinc c2h2 finger domain containing protein [Ophiostoma piceae UAMH 11346]|uniref:Zinc c2h2 finger domain containing protein n=1 Tax=Ophiostoma piceae (strain UAMH 11346) TaxID=1262450 RepID=S3CE12_OPHP1|nr:zinc c2h2 finger domain containing protein [Ophiostoma piceae UAMH 11346]
MASSRDMLQSSPRPFAHRAPPSSSSNAAGSYGSTPLSTSAANAAAGSGFASRTPHSRNSSSHAHSIIGAALNPTHRVHRRKSMNGSSATNVAAVAAVMQEHPNLLESGAFSSSPGSGAAAAAIAAARRSTLAKAGNNFAVSSSLGAFPRGTNAMAVAMSGGLLPSPPASMPGRNFVTADGSAIEDELNDMSDGEIDPLNSAAGNSGAARRASDGRRGSRMELRCRKCGKSYKHSSCLNKHLWEHTPEWALTSRLLISKHQQVQLLEAASVLVTMNVKPDGQSDSEPSADTPPDSTPASVSDEDAPHFDDLNSVATTPLPAYVDGAMTVDSDGIGKPGPWSARFDESLSPRQSVSLSYQSTAYSHGHNSSQDGVRPPSSGWDNTGHEDNELAEAVGMLSCSANSTHGNVHAAAGYNVPPVPLVPAQYLDQSHSNLYPRHQSLAQAQSMTPLGDTSFISSFPSGARESFTRGDHRRSSAVDSRKGGSVSGSTIGEDEEDRMSRARSDDDEDGVFGRMDE